uniref:Tudor domain-containing protein 5 n=1 Tax=Latimeria chalumnae TaxID=7897 RepID=H3AA13_LATCH
MSSQEKLLKSLKKDIRSLLTSAKEGLTPLQLQREYSSMIGSPLPLCTLGYRTIMELILDMPDVVNVQYCADGSVVLTAIADETTKGIAGLVARQKSNPKAKSAMRRARVEFVSSQPFLPRRGKVPPVLPASAKCELKELLSDSPVLLSNFERAFLKRFGRAFQFMRYGFYSMLEVLSTISDIVEVQQTRAGSLLKLRTCLAPDKTKKVNLLKNFLLLSHSPKKTSAGPSLQTALVSAEPNEVSLTPNQPNLDASRDSAEPKLLKLEEEIKAKLVEKGVGGTLDPELKEKSLNKLAAQNPRGLLVSRLLTEFKAVFEEEVQLKELGFQSTVELVEALSDILWVLQPEGCQDCLVFDRETLQKKNLEKGSPSWGFSSSPDLSIQNYYSGWDFPLQDYTAKTENPWEQINTELKVITKPLEQSLQVKELLLCPVTSESEIPPDAMREGFLCRVPEMEENTLVGVFVENVLSPIQFYVRFYSKDTSEMLEDLMIELRRCYSNEEVSERYLMPESYICPGQVCCVKAPGDVWWYRVIINQVLSKQEVEVYYADFGDLGTVDQSCLKFLKCCYSKLPAQAVPSSLAYIKPVKGVWSTAAITWFQTLCGSKPLVGLVSEYVKGVLYLFLCDTSTDDDVYIHDILIKQEHA